VTARREFSDKVKAAIVMRAMNDRGFPVCEGCGGVLKLKGYEIDHRIAEALVVDKSKPLTAEDGQLLGPCCHRGENGKTARDVKVIAKSKRSERKIRFGIKKASRMAGSRNSKWKAKIGGGWELRE
jgi:hypothetical protein